MKKYFLFLFALLALGGVYYIQSQKKSTKKKLKKVTLTVTSSAFDHDQLIPRDYTCDGKDAFIPLHVSGVPKSAKTIAIIVDDPDAPKGLWVHWVAFNIPASVTHISSEKEVEMNGGILGTNSFDRQEWGGPCPPSGTHRYYFKVYALNTELELDESATNKDVLAAMKGHIVGEGKLMGKYAKGK